MKTEQCYGEEQKGKRRPVVAEHCRSRGVSIRITAGTERLFPGPAYVMHNFVTAT
jgi:hypothetical protein